jgi:ribonuclease E
MSRQRLRTGVLEGSTSQCPHCQGTGIIRSPESVALAVLRGLEDAIMAGTRAPLVATTTPSVALYILNNKRPFINDMEARIGLPIMVTGSDKLAGANFTIEKGAAPALPQRRADRTAVNMDWGFEGEEEAGEVEAREPSSGNGREAPASASSERGSEEGGARRRRRRRRGGRRGEQRGEDESFRQEPRSGSEDTEPDDAVQAGEYETADDAGEREPRQQGSEQPRHASGERGERGGRSRRSVRSHEAGSGDDRTMKRDEPMRD